eukprot:CAMPEP_0202898254 /NCGR_PEP_ID=MMETSP1392-20130828/6822_1 /ASSEMBLY_ACC=CAM_ASM_000868 /TAXON_ID=225041 /ORGANISM="Chlamydomonas chlamydogama, Strain SAG 11-48b" /LENGTH=133 /DNA_ID=CAMNT_0049584125 /DNA_START=92 /DNA_END=490 /DNA_ORIENTATION=+
MKFNQLALFGLSLLFCCATIARAALHLSKQDSDACKVCTSSLQNIQTIFELASDAETTALFYSDVACKGVAHGDKCSALTRHMVPVMGHWLRATLQPAHLCSGPHACGTATPAVTLATLSKPALLLPRDSVTC